ncbi:hypothetical protein [Ralstonia solanacearum]|uniref:hypothetical protein n=1 Tax=Ralstonia solanacearum TaxID=305 RepID=UPI0024814F62|nr:hypothetical protein [Ralstonia solanacearum]
MSLRMFPAKIENLRRNPVCLQRYRHVVARKRQHGLTTTLIYATTPSDMGESGVLVFSLSNGDSELEADWIDRLNGRALADEFREWISEL